MAVDFGITLDNDVPVLDTLSSYREAIAGIESAGSGDYNALGPRTKKGDRAYGRYQVMGNNVGPWTKQVLGREMTPQQFRNDRAAQDKVFDGIFGGYVNKYGNPQDAASAWFTGKPMKSGSGRKDILGTTGSGYVAKFNRALGNPSLGSPSAGLAGQRSPLPAPVEAEQSPAIRAALEAETSFGDPAPEEAVPAELQAPDAMQTNMTGMAGDAAALASEGVIDPRRLPRGMNPGKIYELAKQYNVSVEQVLQYFESQNVA